jgi:hypothetical protein
MANPNPVRARLARHQKRRGNLEDLMEKAWKAVLEAETALEYASLPAERTSAIHAMSSIVTSYGKLLQAHEYEARLALVEQRLEELRRA